MNPEEAARLVDRAEAMCDGTLTPPLDPSLTNDWTLIEYITAKNSLLGLQAVGIGERVYFGFLAQSKADPTLFIAVHRGTNPSSIVEWLEDGLAPIVNHFHLGFGSLHNSMECGQPARSVSIGISNRVPLGARVICIGHSLGSPLAAKTTLELRKMNVVATGIFFACPKPGDALFAAVYDELVGADNYRVWDFSRDKVPDMPFTLWPDFMYAHLNSRTVITPSQSTAEIPDDIANNHHASNYALLLAGMKPIV